MIQTQTQLVNTSREYNKLFTQNEFYPVQKAYTTPHFLILVIRFSGQTQYLYLGRGHSYQGCHLSQILAPSSLRVRDKFLDYARKYLVGARIGKMEISKLGFCFSFQYKNYVTDNKFYIGYKDNVLFFSNQTEDKVFISWNGSVVDKLEFPLILQKYLESGSNYSAKENDYCIDEYLRNEEKKNSGAKTQAAKEKFLLRKIDNINVDLKKVSNWKYIEGVIEAEDLSLDGDSISFQDLEIKFLGHLSYWDRKNLIYLKIKKLKKAEKILLERLEETKLQLLECQRGNLGISKTKEFPPKMLWAMNKVKTITHKEFSFKEFKMSSGKLVVGLDAVSNDQLRSMASKENWWFHVEKETGAHGVLISDNHSHLSMEELSLIASILRDHSSLLNDDISIIYTQLKNVKGVKGKSGSVLVKKPHYITCKYLNWKEIISTN